jgi:hypothetical protein
MLSKIIPVALLGTAMAGDHSSRDRIRQFKQPIVKTDCSDAAYAVNRLKAGPENIPEVLK